MRLIDADALRDEVLYDNTYDSHTVNYYLDVIDDAPTIDAGHVVRCGECKFRNTSWYDKRDVLESFCRWDRDESPNDDDYCSYGERKK